MSTYRSLIAGLLAVAAVGAASAAGAQTVQERAAAGALARSISDEAVRAEAGAVGPTQIEAAVVTALKSLIIRSAAEPQVVLIALDDVLTACRPISGRQTPGWSCPASAGAYAGIGSLRTIVVADLSQRNVGAIGGTGSAPLGVIISAPASAGYQSF